MSFSSSYWDFYKYQCEIFNITGIEISNSDAKKKYIDYLWKQENIRRYKEKEEEIINNEVIKIAIRKLKEEEARAIAAESSLAALIEKTKKDL